MELSKFDKFIKSNIKDDLPVPSELSWENMNFVLPPAKQKRRILPWVLFLLIITLGVAIGILYMSQHDNNQSQPLAKNDPINIHTQNSKISLKKEETSKDIANNQVATEKTFTDNSAINEETFITERLAIVEIEEAKPFSLGQAKRSNDIESAKSETQDLSASSLPASTEKTNQILRKLLAPSALLSVLPPKPILYTSSQSHFTFSFSAQNDSKTEQLPKSRSLLLSIGTNRSKMNHSNPRMNNTETPAWGNSYQILFEQEVKDNWLISIGLEYQRLHTTFYFEKDLGTYVNFSRLQVIRQTRRVFHNNYFELVSLNLGGGKQFKFSPRWQGQLLMYLSPSHRLSYTGRYIDDSGAIIALDANSVAQNKWLWNADAALRFSYNLNKTDLIIGVTLSQSLTKSDLLSGSDNMTTVQPQVFGLNLGIKRAL